MPDERREQYTGWSPDQSNLIRRISTCRSRLAYLAASVKDECPEVASGIEREFGFVDCDKSGAISKAEFVAAHGEESGAEFDRIDTDKNGELSRAEYLAAYGKGLEGAMSADWHAKVHPSIHLSVHSSRHNTLPTLYSSSSFNPSLTQHA